MRHERRHLSHLPSVVVVTNVAERTAHFVERVAPQFTPEQAAFLTPSFLEIMIRDGVLLQSKILDIVKRMPAPYDKKVRPLAKKNIALHDYSKE